jgi:alpha-mannosidase
MPHPGDFRQAGVIEQAYALNVPVRAVRPRPGTGSFPSRWSAISVDQRNVVIEAVKKADREDALVVRLYESWGRRGPATLSLGFQVGAGARVDLLERDLQTLEVIDGQVVLGLRPFEIVTLKFSLA